MSSRANSIYVPQESFIQGVCSVVGNPRPLNDQEKAEVRTSFADTLAVAYAGWHEPVVQDCIELYPAGRGLPLDDFGEGSAEDRAFVQGVASHALDYDDVHLTSVTHPSAVIVPALLALTAARPDFRSRIVGAYAVGVAVNIALGRALGFEHYERGWHATSTIGPVAATAALAHLCLLNSSQTCAALSLAAAQAAGLQRNFGTMAKPVQAGFAAAAAVRAARLAIRGVTASDDIFGPKGFFDLYGGGASAMATVTPEIEMNTLSRKLYPCCYASHRLISGAFQIRTKLHAAIPDQGELHALAPFGTLQPLRIFDPRNGAEAKFCGRYIAAVALSQGEVTLADFEDGAIYRPPVRRLMDRIMLREESKEAGAIVGLDRGAVKLEWRQTGATTTESVCAAYPGSPADPASPQAIASKIEDCLAHFNRRAVSPISKRTFDQRLAFQLGETN